MDFGKPTEQPNNSAQNTENSMQPLQCLEKSEAIDSTNQKMRDLVDQSVDAPPSKPIMSSSSESESSSQSSGSAEVNPNGKDQSGSIETLIREFEMVEVQSEDISSLNAEKPTSSDSEYNSGYSKMPGSAFATTQNDAFHQYISLHNQNRTLPDENFRSWLNSNSVDKVFSISNEDQILIPHGDESDMEEVIELVPGTFNAENISTGTFCTEAASKANDFPATLSDSKPQINNTEQQLNKKDAVQNEETLTNAQNVVDSNFDSGAIAGNPNHRVETNNVAQENDQTLENMPNKKQSPTMQNRQHCLESNESRISSNPLTVKSGGPSVGNNSTSTFKRHDEFTFNDKECNKIVQYTIDYKCSSNEDPLTQKEKNEKVFDALEHKVFEQIDNDMKSGDVHGIAASQKQNSGASKPSENENPKRSEKVQYINLENVSCKTESAVPNDYGKVNTEEHSQTINLPKSLESVSDTSKRPHCESSDPNEGNRLENHSLVRREAVKRELNQMIRQVSQLTPDEIRTQITSSVMPNTEPQSSGSISNALNTPITENSKADKAEAPAEKDTATEKISNIINESMPLNDSSLLLVNEQTVASDNKKISNDYQRKPESDLSEKQTIVNRAPVMKRFRTVSNIEKDSAAVSGFEKNTVAEEPKPVMATPNPTEPNAQRDEENAEDSFIGHQRSTLAHDAKSPDVEKEGTENDDIRDLQTESKYTNISGSERDVVQVGVMLGPEDNMGPEKKSILKTTSSKKKRVTFSERAEEKHEDLTMEPSFDSIRLQEAQNDSLPNPLLFMAEAFSRDEDEFMCGALTPSPSSKHSSECLNAFKEFHQETRPSHADLPPEDKTSPRLTDTHSEEHIRTHPSQERQQRSAEENGSKGARNKSIGRLSKILKSFRKKFGKH